MTSFKDRCEGKLSKALQFMVDGLEEAASSGFCEVDMSTFGTAHLRHCVGCAATWGAYRAAGVPVVEALKLGESFDYRKYRAVSLSVHESDLCRWETGINEARLGNNDLLCVYLGLDEQQLIQTLGSAIPTFNLAGVHWAKGLPAVREIITLLQSKGL